MNWHCNWHCCSARADWRVVYARAGVEHAACARSLGSRSEARGPQDPAKGIKLRDKLRELSKGYLQDKANPYVSDELLKKVEGILAIKAAPDAAGSKRKR